MSHRLDPLLRPRSLAVVGASEREGSVGRRTVHNLLAGGFDGVLHAVNPGREQVLGVPCVPRLEDLPHTPEHVVFCLRDTLLEPAFETAIERGVPAATLMSQLIIEDDPAFAERIRQRAEAAGLLLCGPNGMGFYNGRDGVWVCGFDTRENHRRDGRVTLLSQSGAGMSGIVDCEERLDFNLAVSTGSEFTVDLADYLDFALEAHDPVAVGLFLETTRNPALLVAALAKAAARGVPVVALKVGRTKLSARLAESHSGAVAGEDAAWQAVFDRYGVQRVTDMHELTTALLLFAQPHRVPDRGGLVTLHDSGGERQLLVDLAEELDVPLTELASDSVAALEARLDPGLPAVNPLDAWGAGGPDADQAMADCLAILMRDPDAAIGAVVQDRAPYSRIYPEYLDYLRAGIEASGKPAVLVANHAGSGADPAALEATRNGLLVVDGVRPFLVAVKALLRWRDARCRTPGTAPRPDEEAVAAARERLSTGEALGEVEALELLARCGLPAVSARAVGSREEALAAAAAIDGPVALKTAQPGLTHKSDRGGVHLGLVGPEAVSAAWEDLAERLGPAALVSPMAPTGGVELLLGLVHDAQFGPLVVLGFGGVAVEALDDTVCALPPFDRDMARRLLDRLRLRPLLDLNRGRSAPDVEAFVDLAARFSAVAAALADHVAELDLNPVIVHAGGCHIVDALIIPAPPASRRETAPHRRIAS